MADDTSQRAAHRFLLERLQSQQPFTLREFGEATGWVKPGTMNTHLSKHYIGFFEKLPGDQYRVTDAFRRLVTWRRFKAHVSQVRRVVTDYEPTTSEVLIYDFLMPLTNEEHLRMTLDSLFYRDGIEARLRTIGETELARHFPRNEGTSEKQYITDILEFIRERFVGYSVSHVDGRFRSEKLLTYDEASEREMSGQRYLIDETTAAARFIFPYHDQVELGRVEFLFQTLFIRSIIQLVNGEEQIWMLQSGSAGSRLHVWHAVTGEED